MCALIFYHTTAVTVKLVQDVQCATSKFLVFWHWSKICNKNYATHSQDFGLQKKWKLCILQLCTPPHCDHGTGEKPLSTPPKKQFPLLNKVLQNGETCVTSHEKNPPCLSPSWLLLWTVCVCVWMWQNSGEPWAWALETCTCSSTSVGTSSAATKFNARCSKRRPVMGNAEIMLRSGQQSEALWKNQLWDKVPKWCSRQMPVLMRASQQEKTSKLSTHTTPIIKRQKIILEEQTTVAFVTWNLTQKKHQYEGGSNTNMPC